MVSHTGYAGGPSRSGDFNDESVVTALSTSSACVNWNMEGYCSTPPQPSHSTALPPSPPPQTLPLSPQPSGYAAPPPESPALSPPPPQPSSYAAPPAPPPSPPPPPQTPPLELELALALAPPPWPFSYAAPPPPPPPQNLPLSLELPPAPQPSSYAAPPPPRPRHQREAHGRRGRQSDSLDLYSSAPQRRRVSDPNQPHPLSDKKPPRPSSGHQEPKHEVPDEGWNKMVGHTPPSRLIPQRPSGSGAPPSSSPPVPTSAVPSSSTFKLNMTAGTNSSNGFQVVKAFLKDVRASTVFLIQFICSCGAKSKHTMKAITNHELKDRMEVECRCRKKYIIKLMSNKFFLFCFAGKRKKKIGYITGSLASADDQIDDE